MRILLVKPPFARLLQSDTYLTYPLGAMLVAAGLKRQGHEVKVYHDDVSNPASIPRGGAAIGGVRQRPIGDIELGPYLRVLDDFAPDVVGFGFCTVDAEAAHSLAKVTKERGYRTVAGGVHPSLVPAEELHSGLFDTVIVGEGEEAEVAFYSDVRGAYHCPPAQDLDEVLPDRECVIGGERYSPFLRGLIYTQRGCPYQCAYCAAPTIFGRHIRTRDPGSVREEVESLNTTEGRIIDDSFGADRRHAFAVCEELSKTRYRWVCDMALPNADPQMLENCAIGGCSAVNIGLESGAERWRALSGKRVLPGEAEKALTAARSIGLKTVFYFMIGFPGETAEELKATLTWARRLKEQGAHPCISVVTPYPRTKLWELAFDYCGGQVGDWASCFHQSAVMGFADCSEEEWQAAVAEANQLNV